MLIVKTLEVPFDTNSSFMNELAVASAIMCQIRKAGTINNS